MLVELAGLTYVGYNFGMTPLPLRAVQDCETPSFVMEGFTDEEVMKRVKLFQESVYNISKSNVFFIDIVRKKPEPIGVYDNIANGAFLSMFATTVDINNSYYGTNSVNAGTQSIKHMDKKESGGVDVTFRNPSRNIASEYFLKKDGEPILPTDGTALLPTEYYFWIEVWKWVVIEDVRVKSHYVKGYYHIDSNLSVGFDVENKELQTFTLSFSKMATGLKNLPL